MPNQINRFILCQLDFGLDLLIGALRFPTLANDIVQG